MDSRMMKQVFIRRLAEFLVKDQAEQSIRLSVNDPHAQAWANLRHTTPIFGWPTVDEAVDVLATWLGVDMPKPEKPRAPKAAKKSKSRRAVA